jgi:SAM-dependent methyltransferase
MDEVLERQIHDVEEWHWWYRGRRRVIGALVERLGLPPGTEILDAGCGSGRNMADLAHYGTVTGLELADASVLWARNRGVGTVVQGSITEAPFADDRFDFAVSLDVLEHIEDDRKALRELRRVVRPGAILLVTVPAYQWLWSEHDMINHHKRRYTRRTLATVAAAAGWVTVWSSYFNCCLLPVAATHRRLARLRHSVDEPVSDLGLTPVRLNGLLEAPLHLEARIIGSGRQIPAGLSLMAVLRKGAGAATAASPRPNGPGSSERLEPAQPPRSTPLL